MSSTLHRLDPATKPLGPFQCPQNRWLSPRAKAGSCAIRMVLSLRPIYSSIRAARMSPYCAVSDITISAHTTSRAPSGSSAADG